MFMFDKALRGGPRYWLWLAALGACVVAGALAWRRQLALGLGVTGLTRDVTWGLYIAQFTFFVGVAASAVMVVLPYYLHDVRTFARLTILGEFLAMGAVVMCGLFIFVDMGQPARIFNVLRYPSPASMMFWDMLALGGYFILNAVITLVMLSAERIDREPPPWIRPVIIVSIPWAISIHTVTAFLYSGLPGRSFWLTAVLVPRFLASAFASGPALLILFCLLARRVTAFDTGREPIQKLAVIVAYALALHLFLLAAETFTVFYGAIPEHVEHFTYLFAGLEGHAPLVPWMWTSVGLSLGALVLLLVPASRRREPILALACGMLFVSLWIEKGIGTIVGGFVPSPLGAVTAYRPTLTEVVITVGIWAVGLLMVTVFYRITIAIRTGEQA